MAPPTKRRRTNVISSSSPESSFPLSDKEHKAAVQEGKDDGEDISSATSTPEAKKPALAQKRTTRSTRGSARLSQTQLTPTKTQAPNQTRLKAPSTSRAGTKSASSSPEKARGKGKKDAGIGKHADLFTLFSNQAQRPKKPIADGSNRGTSKNTAIEILDDDIITSDDEIGEIQPAKDSIIGWNAKKRSQELISRDVPESRSGSQRFLQKTPAQPALDSENGKRPWAERFAPTNLEELAVHKRKVGDVRSWLEASLDGRIRQKLLVLKGPAGTGKTATVELLAQALGCELLEWHNPIGSVGSSDGFLSMTAQFEDFIGRGQSFGQLELFSSEPTTKSSQPLERKRSIIVIEEFPNTFTRSSTGLQSFRTALLQYVESCISFQKREIATPVVLIISETLLTTMSASADSFTAHRLLGPKLLQHPGVTTIEFNPIAPTFITKALELVVQKESRVTGRRRTPGPLVLKRLGEVGDIRSAIGSLEFLCLRGDADGDWGGRVLFTKPKKGAKAEVGLTKMEQESLELVTRREASLGIFHAVGKVVYNKRDELPPPRPAGDEPDPEDLPDYLRLQSRPRRSQVSLDELIDETGTDTQTFIAALHENYALSCEAPHDSRDYSTLDHLNDCIDALSDADLLTPSWDGSFNSSGFGGGAGGRGSGGDILRQDEMCFQIATRGILFSLPNPVRRQAIGNGYSRNTDHHKMFYPMSLKLWRLQEAVEGALDACSVPHQRLGDGPGSIGQRTSSLTSSTQGLGVVESWSRNRQFESVGNTTGSQSARQDVLGSVLALGSSARQELVLDRLPYQYQILKAQGQRRLSTSHLRSIEKVVIFRGLDANTNSEEDIGEIEVDEAASKVMAGEWATDKPIDESPRKKRIVSHTKRKTGQVMDGLDATYLDREAKNLEVKLVLSDDDIEDDY